MTESAQRKHMVRPSMLTYTIALAALLVLIHFYGHQNSTARYPLAYRIWDAFVTIPLLFAGNILYSFGVVSPLIRRVWKFAFPVLILQFVVSGFLEFYFPQPGHTITPVVGVFTCISMLVLFFPTFRAHFLLGYGNIDLVRTIDRPVIVSADPLHDLVGEITRLRRTAQAGWIVAILLLTALVLLTFFQIHFEPKDDSWVTVRRLADATKYDEALAVAHRLVDKDPDSPQTRVLMANLQLSMGQLHQAEASFTRAYELLPTEPIANMLNAVRKRIDDTDPTPTPSSTP